MAGLFHELPVFGQSAQGLQIAWSELAALAGKMLGHGGEIRIFLRTQGNVQPVGQMDEIAQTGVPAACAGRAPRGMVVEDQGMDGLRQSRCLQKAQPAREWGPSLISKTRSLVSVFRGTVPISWRMAAVSSWLRLRRL